MTRPHESGAGDVIHVPQAGKGAPGDSGKAGDEHQTQGQHQAVAAAGTQETDDQQRQQDAGEGCDGVVDPHQRLIRPAAEITGDRAHGDADSRADSQCGQGHGDGGPQALQRPAENVPAEFVRAEQVSGGGREKFGGSVRGGGGAGGPEDAQQRQQQHGGGDQRPGNEIAVAALFEGCGFVHARSPNLSRGSTAWLMRSASVPDSTTQKARITTMVSTTG